MNQIHHALAAALMNTMLLTAANLLQTEVRTEVVQQPQNLKASTLIWKNRCAVERDNQDRRATLYCLNAPKPHAYPVSADFNDVVKKWLADHPDSYVMHVFSTPLFLSEPNGPAQVYTWVVDGDSNLNIHLVRMGACPAQMMKLESGEKPAIDEGIYESFTKQLAEAEREAKTRMLGIWSTHAPRL